MDYRKSSEVETSYVKDPNFDLFIDPGLERNSWSPIIDQ